MALLLLFFHFMVDFVVSFPAPLSPYFIHHYGLDARTAAMSVATLAFTGSLSQVLFAFRRHDRPFRQAYLSMSFTLIPLFFLGLPVPFLAVFLLFFAVYLADGAFHPLGAALAGINQGGKGITSFISGGILGGALGPVFITWFVPKYTLLRLPFLPLFTLLPLSLWFLREEKPSLCLERATFSWRLFSLLWPIWFVVSSRTFISSVFHTFVPIAMAEKGYPLLSGGILLSSGVLLGIAANTLGNRLRSFLSNGKINLLSFLVLGGSVLAFTVVHRLFLLFFFYILADFATFLTMSTNVTEAQKLLPEHRVFASSLSMGFAWALGHTLNLLWASLFGNHTSFVLQSIGLIALGITFTLFFLERATALRTAEAESKSTPT
ncbi:MAG: MFS transporter [Atribacterota bacterium]